MAAPHTLSSSANSLEKQFYELALALFSSEQSVPEENRPDNVQISFDTEANQVQITAALRVTPSYDGSAVTFAAINYLP